MSDYYLIVTKPPEFDERGEVVLGQCEPFTSGWRLLLVPRRKERTLKEQYETLLEGTYTDLRKIQESCASLTDHARIRKRVEEMRVLQRSSVTETVAMELNSHFDSADATRIMEPTRTDLLPVVDEEQDDPVFAIEEKSGVILAMIETPEKASDLAALNRALKQLLDRRPKAIVLNLERIQHLATRAVHEWILFRDHCLREKVDFGLCGVRKNVIKLMNSMDLQSPLEIFEDVDDALAKILIRNGKLTP